MSAFLAGETAREAVARYDLTPHPFDGWSKRLSPHKELRLFGVGDFVHWHRAPCVMTWQHKDGAPLALSQSQDGVLASGVHLGAAGSGLQELILSADTWMAAESIGSWSLVLCTTSAAICLDDLTLAPEDWFPGPEHA